MRDLLKKGLTIVFLVLLCGMAACGAGPDTAAPTLNTTTSTADQIAESPVAEENRAPTAIEQAGPTPAPQNLLDAAATFEVIAAVHANLLEIQGWLPRGFSVFERQAVVQPIAQISIAPVSAIFTEYLPHPDLAKSWQQAAQLQQDFYPQLMQWVDGELGDAEFAEILARLAARSAALIADAEQAAGQLGVEISQYPPDYALAREVVFRLAPGVGGQNPEPGDAPGVVRGRQENPDLVVRELNPFVYPFAGMDVFLTVGLLENTSAQPQQAVEVEIRFYNFLGEHLGTMLGRLLARVALPGEVYPFSASIVTEGEEAALKNWVEYEVTVFSHPAAAGETTYQDFDLSVSSTSLNSAGSTIVLGTLTNLGGQTVQAGEIRVGVIAFDASGKLVGVGNGFITAGESISPGKTTSFQAVLEAVSGEPANFQFFAEVSP